MPEETRQRILEFADYFPLTANQLFAAEVPEVFIKALGWSKEKDVAPGRLRTYSAQPVEKAQRVSTIARSVNSLELALGLAASMDKRNTGSLDAKLMRQATGNVEALERQPIVVGYANNRPAAGSEAGSAASAGWVFGPPAQINAKDEVLELHHRVRQHEVSVDVAIPGWWPYVKVRTDTAWPANWHNVTRAIGQKSENTRRVDLPLNRADLDGLTNIILQRTVGSSLSQAHIASILPFSVPVCAPEATLQIHGANVWRSTEVHLAGHPAKEVRILPNMEGIAATFDMNALFGDRNLVGEGGVVSERVPLTVWTRDGHDVTNIWLNGRRQKSGDTWTCAAGRHFADGRDRDDLAILSVSPGVLRTCSPPERLLAYVVGELRDLLKLSEPRFWLNGRPVEGERPSSTNLAIGPYEIQVTKEDLASIPQGGSAELTVAAGPRMAIYQVPVQHCTAPIEPQDIGGDTGLAVQVSPDPRFAIVAAKKAKAVVKLSGRVPSHGDWRLQGALANTRPDFTNTGRFHLTPKGGGSSDDKYESEIVFTAENGFAHRPRSGEMMYLQVTLIDGSRVLGPARAQHPIILYRDGTKPEAVTEELALPGSVTIKFPPNASRLDYDLTDPTSYAAMVGFADNAGAISGTALTLRNIRSNPDGTYQMDVGFKDKPAASAFNTEIAKDANKNKAIKLHLTALPETMATLKWVIAPIVVKRPKPTS